MGGITSGRVENLGKEIGKGKLHPSLSLAVAVGGGDGSAQGGGEGGARVNTVAVITVEVGEAEEGKGKGDRRRRACVERKEARRPAVSAHKEGGDGEAGELARSLGPSCFLSTLRSFRCVTPSPGLYQQARAARSGRGTRAGYLPSLPFLPT